MEQAETPITFKEIIYETPEVIEQVRQWRNRDSIRQWMATNHIISEEEHSKWIESLRKEAVVSDKKISRQIFIIYNKNLSPIGIVNLQDINWKHSSASWGIYVAEKIPGENIGSKAISFIMSYAFDALHLQKVNSTVFGNNEKSLVFNYSCGMKLQGIFKNEIQFDPSTRVDLHCFGMTKEDWKNK